MDMDSMTVKELKQELKSRGLKQSGKKAELKLRLSEALTSEQTIVETTQSLTNDNPDQDINIADFEEYINAEHKRLKNNEKEQAEKEKEVEVNIDDIINKNNESIVEDEEKHQELLTDFDLSTPQQPPQPPQQQEIVSDFAPITANVSSDPNALNNKDKVQDRMNRFGTKPISAMDDKDKIESRKRRFAAMDNNNQEITNGQSPPSKKQRIDIKAEREKMFARSQKFGTTLPKNFKLTKEQSAVVHADKIERAKRFGTEHLLPKEIQKAEQDSKKQERMKRFNTNENGKIINPDFNDDEPPKNIIKADDDPDQSTKLMERKLRFGTTTEADKQKQRQQRFGTGNKDKNNALSGDMTLDEMKMNNNNNNKMIKKKFTPRQQRSNERIQRFRQYKKNKNNFNNNNNNNNGQFQRRGRGGFRTRGNNNGGNRGRGGRFRNGYNNRNFNNGFNNNQQRGGGGYRNNNNNNFNGNNNGNNFNRRGRGNFNGNFNGNFINNNKRQGQQTTPVKFTAEDLKKIEQRKQRFTALADF